jgi:hypothetical protein
MIDWNARIDDLMEALERHWGINDRTVVECLLAAQLNVPRTPVTWIVLETPWYDRHCEHGWFSFGGIWPVMSMAYIRHSGQAYQMRSWSEIWLTQPKARLFIEPDFQALWKQPSRLPQYRFITQRALRFRTPLPKTDFPLRTLDFVESAKVQTEVGLLAKKILNDPTGARSPVPPKFRPNFNFCYHLEVLQKLSPFYSDWNVLATTFAAMAVRRAHLFGRTATDESDLAALSRMASDMVPQWIALAFERLSLGPATLQHLAQVMSLRPWKPNAKYYFETSAGEVYRLGEEGLIKRRKPEAQATIVYNPNHIMAIRNLIDGFGFTGQRNLDLGDGRKLIGAPSSTPQK